MSAWDGFPPEGLVLTCSRCGEELSGRGGDRPAETYAGTYTGLCYGCQRTRAFPRQVDELDGAVWWEWPPHSPSWRRDRETYVAYDGCEDCGGRGRRMVSRPDARGGSYPRNCPACWRRWLDHPVRVLHRKRRARLKEAADRAYRAGLRDAGHMPPMVEITEEERRELARGYLERYRLAVARWAPGAV